MEDKKKLFLVKKKIVDRFPIIYETKYIEQVEEKFINPYFDKGNEKYTEIVENKRSKIPMIFNL